MLVGEVVSAIKYDLVVPLATTFTFVSTFGLFTHLAVPSELQPKNCPLEPPEGICLLPEVVG